MIAVGLILLFGGQSFVKGHPLHQHQQSHCDQTIETELSNFTVNVTTFQRGINALLIPNNYTHKLPLKFIEQGYTKGYNITERPHRLKQESFEHYLTSIVSCSSCKAGILFLKRYASHCKSENDLPTLIEICISFKILPAEVCDGLMKRFAPQILFILNRSHFDVNEYCATLISNDDCMGSGKSMNENWEIPFPSIPKPTPKDLKSPTDDSSTFKVLHITDTHYDPLYAEGSNAVCKEPLCCRDKTQIVLKQSDAAGKWGDYRNCDPPKATIDNMLDHIVEQHPVIQTKFFLNSHLLISCSNLGYLGDVQPHNVWSDNKHENLKLLRDMVATMLKKFPNIPIFPAIGNHETTPANNFPPPYIQEPQFLNNWLFDEIDVQWRNWLPENVSLTIKYGGFYSILVRPGFRIISLNTNYCYSANFWLLMNATDSASVLQWLVYELQAAELANEKVHIIGHVPPGHVDCMRLWSRNYYRIIARFESTVTGQFFGHTHGDEIEVFYDPDNLNRATNILYIGPSVTPYSLFNPGYKIYYVDGDHADTSRMVIDMEAWIFNLNDANIKGTPYWYKLYSARASYGMVALRPSDWNEFINKMISSDKMFDLYHRHYWRDSPKRPSCDIRCKKQFICDARSGRSHDRKVLCENVLNSTSKFD